MGATRPHGLCKVFPDSYFPLLVVQFDVVIAPLEGGAGRGGSLRRISHGPRLFDTRPIFATNTKSMARSSKQPACALNNYWKSVRGEGEEGGGRSKF